MHTSRYCLALRISSTVLSLPEIEEIMGEPSPKGRSLGDLKPTRTPKRYGDSLWTWDIKNPEFSFSRIAEQMLVFMEARQDRLIQLEQKGCAFDWFTGCFSVGNDRHAICQVPHSVLARLAKLGIACPLIIDVYP